MQPGYVFTIKKLTKCNNFVSCFQPAVYALEGSVAVAGGALSWLETNLGIVKNTSGTQPLNQLLRTLF